MIQAIRNIWKQVMADDIRPFAWFFVPCLFLLILGLLVIIVSFSYLDWVVAKKYWGLEFILIPFEIAVLGFFHAFIILWGEE